MRKLIVGLIAVAVLAVAAPAMAQFTDPLGLISSGAVIPFVGTGGAISGNHVAASFLEVASPVGDNSNFHMFFFDSNCSRAGDSVGLPVTENGIGVLRVDNIQPTDRNPAEGLIAAAGVDGTGFALQPLENPVHMRVMWFDVTSAFARTLEPIAVDTAEFSLFSNGPPPFSFTTWDPLRSGATFFTPLVGSGFDTTIFFICPNTAVTNDITNANVGAFPITRFPALVDSNGHPPQTSGAQTATSLRVRVFDPNEVFLRDLRTTCGCLTARPLAASPAQGGISDIFHDAIAAPNGTVSEVEGDTVAARAAVCDFTTQTGTTATNPGAPAPDCSQFTGQAAGPIPNTPCTAAVCNTFQTFRVVTPSQQAAGPAVFTGYRAMPVNAPGLPKMDLFGRLSNSSALSLRGSVVPVR